MTAATANRNTISEEASFSRLSPSIIHTSDFGTFRSRMIVVAEMASGGEMMPPNKNPSANVKPGIRALDVSAMMHEVRMTIIKAKLLITLRHFQNSFHEVCQAAS